MPIALIAVLTSITVALAGLLNTTSLGFNEFFNVKKDLTNQQTAILASSTVVASESSALIDDIAASIKKSIASARNVCIRHQDITRSDDVVVPTCVEFKLVLDQSINQERVNAVNNFQNKLMNFEQKGHKIRDTFDFGANGGYDSQETILRNLDLDLISSSKIAILAKQPSFFNSFSYRFTNQKLASTLLSKNNPSITKTIEPYNIRNTFLSGNTLKISDRLLRSILSDREYDFTNQYLDQMNMIIIRANDSSNSALDYTELPNGIKATLKVATGTKEIEDPNNPHNKIPEENIEDLSLYGAAQLRTLNATTTSISDDDASDERCLNGELPVNGVCPSDTVCEGSPEECDPCPINTYRDSDGSCTTCREQGNCTNPNPPEDCVTAGLCCDDFRFIPPEGCDPVEDEEAYDFYLDNYNPNLYDIIYDPAQPIGPDNPVCIISKKKKPKNKAWTCYYIDENGDLVVTSGVGFKMEDGQIKADPDDSIFIGTVGDPNAENPEEINLEARPRRFQDTGKLTTGFTTADGVNIPRGAVVVKKVRPNGKVEFQFYDPVTGALLAIVMGDDLPKDVRKDANSSIKEFDAQGGAGIDDLFSGNVEAFLNFEDTRGDLTDSKIAGKNGDWRRKNKNHKGEDLGDGTVKHNGEEYESSAQSPLLAELDALVESFAQLRDLANQQKGTMDEKYDAWQKAKNKVAKITSQIQDLKAQLRNAKSKKERDRLKARIDRLKIDKDKANSAADGLRNNYETAKGNYEDTQGKKKAAKERINEINRQLKS